MGDKSAVWYGAIVRGDAPVSIGAHSQITDKAILGGNTTIGSNVFVGMRASIAGATVKDGAVIGMAATVGEGATIGEGAYVAPGAVVPPGATVAAGKVVAGAPASELRAVSEDEAASLTRSMQAYSQLSVFHVLETRKDWMEVDQDKRDRKWRDDRSEDYGAALGLLEKNPRAQVW